MKKLKTTRLVTIDQYTDKDISKIKPEVLHFSVIDADGKLPHWLREMGHTQVGVAEIEVEFFSQEQLTMGAIGTLKTMRQKELAESQQKINKIDEAIQNLLAIANQ